MLACFRGLKSHTQLRSCVDCIANISGGVIFQARTGTRVEPPAFNKPPVGFDPTMVVFFGSNHLAIQLACGRSMVLFGCPSLSAIPHRESLGCYSPNYVLI